MALLTTAAMLAVLTKLTEKAFDHLADAIIEESGAEAAIRQQVRKRLGKQSPEQMAFRLALERALNDLDAEKPGWTQSLFDAQLLSQDATAQELAKALWRRGRPDAGVLARAWAQQLGTERADLQGEAQDIASAFLHLLDEELDAPDVRPALAPLRDSRDLGVIRDQNEVLRTLVEQVLRRLDAQSEMLASQSQILSAAAQQGMIRVERNVTVHGNLSQAIIITGDGNRVEVTLSAETLTRLMQASAADASRQLRKNYLQSLLEQAWSSVSMSLFAPQDPSLGKRVKLTAIYTPLSVQFPLTLKFAKDGRLADWWAGSDRAGADERLAAEEAVAWPEMRGREMKPRQWPEMGLNEADLRPLVDIAAQEISREGRPQDETHTWQPDACHAALVQPHFVLVGDPGSGKSTFLRHLAQCWAGHLLRSMGEPGMGRAAAGLENLPGWDAAYAPIYLELRRVVDDFPKLPENQQQAPELPGLSTFRAFLEHAFGRETCEWLFGALRRGEAAILLDGLDEIAQADDPRRRAQIQAFVGALQEEFSQARIIVTSRPYAYRQSDWRLAGFGRASLAPLPRARQALLAQRLFRQLDPYKAKKETKAFVRALDKIPADLSSNPLLLTLLVALWKNRKEDERGLPSTRGELYRRGLKLLLEDWVRQKNRNFSIEKDLNLNAGDMQLVLQLVAAHAQEKRKEVDEDAEITEGDFFTALRAIRRGDAADKLVDHLEGQAGVLQELAEKRPGAMLSPYTKRFRFLHQSFQECVC